MPTRPARTSRGCIPATSPSTARSPSSFAGSSAAAFAYTLTPGVPAFAAAAAALGTELTVPEVAQSVVLTRMPGRASAMPEGEQLAAFAATGATLAIHLAIPAIATIVRELTPFYGADCPAAVVVRASWPQEAYPARHARRHRRQGRGRADRAHRARSRRPGARRKGFPRQRAVRSGLSASVSRRRKLVDRIQTHRPHPEEPCAARRLEGWPRALRPMAVLRDARKSALLRTRSIDDIDMIRAAETLC